jgi:MFS family permease
MTELHPGARPIPTHVLPIIIFAQFCGTSLWFATNAVTAELTQAFDLAAGAESDLTAAVQLGFIAGTLVLAFLNLADRFSPARVFLAATLLGVGFNTSIIFFADSAGDLLALRFLTGCCLAGIYPVGMKIAADWFPGQLGQVLGILVGALVMGTALPHGIRYLGADWNWTSVIASVSGLALVGGLALFWGVGDGPYRKPATAFRPDALLQVFRVRDFRAAAFGYFGHMWELYALWTFLPILLLHYQSLHPDTDPSVSLWSFLVIAAGGVGCAAGGYASRRFGSAPVAFTALILSGLACLGSYWLYALPFPVLAGILLLWGVAVAADSPQLSALNARTAPPEWIGSALTITTSIGFAITIFSIQLLKYLSLLGWTEYALLFLAPGPVLGLVTMRRLVR